MSERIPETLLKKALTGLATTVFAKPPPKTSAVSRVKLIEHDGPTDAPRPVDLDEVARRVVQRFSKGELPERSDLRHAAFCIWETQPSLVDNPFALQHYLEWVTHLHRKADFRRLAEAYVRCFDNPKDAIDQVAAVLSHTVNQVGGRWSERAQEYRIFDPHQGPRALARLALSQDVDPVHFLLERNHWPESLAMAGFARAAWIEGIGEISRTLMSERDRFQQLILWNGSRSHQILFSEMKGPFVNALTGPYKDSGPGDKSLRDLIMNFLLGALGDPRILPQKWVGLNEAAVIVNRWLVEQSFRQFLDVVEKISANEQQWEYRRAFWEGVYKKCQEKRIELRAWVVFAEEGAKAARKSFGSNVSFGVFRYNSPGLKELTPRLCLKSVIIFLWTGTRVGRAIFGENTLQIGDHNYSRIIINGPNLDTSHLGFAPKKI